MFFHGKSPFDAMAHILEYGGAAVFLAVNEGKPARDMHWSQLILATRETHLMTGSRGQYMNDVVGLFTLEEYFQRRPPGVIWLPSPRGFVNNSEGDTWFRKKYQLLDARENKERVLIAMRWAFNMLTRDATQFARSDGNVLFEVQNGSTSKVMQMAMDSLDVEEAESDCLDGLAVSRKAAERAVVEGALDKERNLWMRKIGHRLHELGVPLPTSRSQHTIERSKWF